TEPALARRARRPPSEVDQRDDRNVAQGLAPRKKRELDHERVTREDGALPRHELADRGRGAAGRDQIVDDEIPFPGDDRVRVHLEMVDAVLERVLDADRFARKLAALPHKMHRQAELVRERGAEDEAPGFDRENALRTEPVDA